MKTVSIIIPTLNEEAYLPGLLEAIRQQTCPPFEVIVADAGSTDRTVEIALQAGCRVVPGGRPARGRNAAAAVARGDIFLFLDADVLPEPEFLAASLEELERRGLDAATCPVQPLGGNLTDAIFHQIANAFIKVARPFYPHAPGFCIWSSRQTHASIGGFDETLPLSEDHDYVRRVVAQGGRFGILRVPIPVSIRRLETDGRWNVAVRYSFLTINQMMGNPFSPTLLDRYLGEYRFGHHAPTTHFHRIKPVDSRDISLFFSYRRILGQKAKNSRYLINFGENTVNQTKRILYHFFSERSSFAVNQSQDNNEPQ
ncbi:MAG: glycosyltransferase [Caldilineales bacterium]|nr:glycosyltransferase [Caldilineales bacterium]